MGLAFWAILIKTFKSMTNEIYNQLPDTIVELFQIDIMNTNIFLQKKEYNQAEDCE